MKQRGEINLLLFALVGGGTALFLFLIMFITTQKAAQPNPRANLRIPVPSVPEIILPSPHYIPSPIIEPASPAATPKNTQVPRPSAPAIELEQSPIATPSNL
jgi:hypothetical protein